MMKYRHDNREEDIRCSAIWFQDGVEYPHQPRNVESGYVLCGLRHHNCIANRFVVGMEKIPDSIQGFLTSRDRFVDRKEGAKIALQQGQIEQEVDILFSEDLY